MRCFYCIKYNELTGPTNQRGTYVDVFAYCTLKNLSFEILGCGESFTNSV